MNLKTVFDIANRARVINDGRGDTGLYNNVFSLILDVVYKDTINEEHEVKFYIETKDPKGEKPTESNYDIVVVCLTSRSTGELLGELTAPLPLLKFNYVVALVKSATIRSRQKRQKDTSKVKLAQVEYDTEISSLWQKLVNETTQERLQNVFSWYLEDVVVF